MTDTQQDVFFYHGAAETVAQDFREKDIRFAIEMGRRAPMHRAHVDCLREVVAAGLQPLIFIGSANGAESPFFDPLRNPLTVAQQKEQLARAVPDIYDENFIYTMADVGNHDRWLDIMSALLEQHGYTGKTVMHYRRKQADAQAAGKKIQALSHYMAGFAARGVPPWESVNRDPAFDAMNSSDLRFADLDNLTPQEYAAFAVPSYIRDIAQAARNNNPDRDLLAHIPVTVFDLSLERMRLEAGISTAAIVAQTGKATQDTDIGTLAETASRVLKKRDIAQSFPVKIAAASCNQTGGDWPRNLANICAAIDRAVADGADILSFEELTLCGYDRGDDFFYADNRRTREMLQIIADYAAAQNPALLISVGHPWYFADKDLSAAGARRKNPIFNRTDLNFNVQSLLSGGEIVSMSAKRYLFNSERGYEKRHFEEWSDEAANAYDNENGKGRHGTIMLTLPQTAMANGTILPAKTIPFGSPVVQLGTGARRVNVTHVICEEYWIGSRYDGTLDNADYGRDNPLAQKSRDFDITVALNPNASPPAAGKIEQHRALSRLASQYCGVFVHTDGLGSSGSTFAQCGSRLIAQDGRIVSEGVRLSFADMAYTSQVVTLRPPVDKGAAPHAVVPHEFSAAYAPPVQDGPAAWENGSRRDFEDEMRNELLWLFDYMRKNRIQGMTQALSGGADSAYNAAKIRLMVELAVNERGVDGFLSAMDFLPYADKVRAAAQTGPAAAIDCIMENMLTCVYMGTDNSSAETLHAARTLVEGGIDENGKAFKGIGGKFHVRNVQRLVDIYAEVFSGVNPAAVEQARDNEIRTEIGNILRLRADDVTATALQDRIDALKSRFSEVCHDVLSVADPKHRLAYENMQARLRQVLILLFANVENKSAIANPNLDEARNSYATWGGDLHSGMISGNAHKGKALQLEHMRLLAAHGLQNGAAPVAGFYWVLKNKPSAELQPRDKDGKVTQFDEDQLGRSFAQMDVISHLMLTEKTQGRKNSPIEVFEKCRNHPVFQGDDAATLHDRIRVSYDKWAHAQFKIHGSPIAATYGRNVDHQTSLRTSNTGAFHRPELAEMTLCVLEIMARDAGVHIDVAGLKQRARYDHDFAAQLNAIMWDAQAADGRPVKITRLFQALREKGTNILQTTGVAADILAAAAAYRRDKAALEPHRPATQQANT